jgi:hypothetical protein
LLPEGQRRQKKQARRGRSNNAPTQQQLSRPRDAFFAKAPDTPVLFFARSQRQTPAGLETPFF